MRTKRLLCLALAMLMVFSASAVVFAEERPIQANARTGTLSFVFPQGGLSYSTKVYIKAGEKITVTLAGELDNISIGLCTDYIFWNPPVNFLLKGLPVEIDIPDSDTTYTGDWYFMIWPLRDQGDYDINYGYINYSITP